ncbi:hypothetical protein TNCV_994221 [Trichonephila clavipes]|nr:hypothetical protein TNCV_994221 [Trichonephila clavipes]
MLAMYKETGLGLIPSILYLVFGWLGVATWRLVVGGVSEARANEMVGADRENRVFQWLNVGSEHGFENLE